VMGWAAGWLKWAPFEELGGLEVYDLMIGPRQEIRVARAGVAGPVTAVAFGGGVSLGVSNCPSSVDTSFDGGRIPEAMTCGRAAEEPAMVFSGSGSIGRPRAQLRVPWPGCYSHPLRRAHRSP